MEQTGYNRDHIYVRCTAHPKYAPGQLVRVVKSITVRKLFKRFPMFRKELWRSQAYHCILEVTDIPLSTRLST
jgi:REP element-mobilizing transposase RayT